MLPISFPEENFTFTKPEGWNDEECSDLHVYKGNYGDGQPCIISAWKPNKEDLEALNTGGVIYLNICSNGMPPVSLSTESPFVTSNQTTQ